ncbi:MAG TPA: ABC transporter ATP-binding protein, partial [Hanamia sp.]|nr:ABC transporter ATP-binding protein [Hanamia sp.]
MPLLQIKDFSVDFVTDSGTTSAVQNISFEINRGETVAIVGESGSGKTVTSLSILKLLPSPPARYTSGQILFSQEGKNETDIVKLDAKSIQKIRGNQISMVFQEPMTSLNPVKTCGKQVMEAIRTHYNISKKEARKRTISLFEKVKLPDPQSIVDRYPHEISGGQKQRVMIAMAISCNPSLLIADEPTTALDVTVQKTILQLIKDLQKEQNMSVIYITHDLGLVSEIADRVIVMYKGKVVESGPIKEIFLDPQNPYTKALLACRPDSSAKGKRLPVVGDFLEDAGGDAKPETIFSKAPRNDHFDAAQTILSVENLKVYFPVKRNFFGKILKVFKAVDDVSFEVKKGETVGLVGESGCGKTTLGRSILRLIEPTSGAIYLNDKNIGNIPEGQFRKMR